MKPTQLVMINRECDKKNKFYNIAELTDDEIQKIINEFDKQKWLAHKR